MNSYISLPMVSNFTFTDSNGKKISNIVLPFMFSRLDITAVSIFTKVSDVQISTLILRQRPCMFSSCLIFEECYIFEIESGVKSLLFVCLGNDLRPYCSLPPMAGLT